MTAHYAATLPMAITDTTRGSPEDDQSLIMIGLERILAETEFAWSLGLVGEDQAGKLARLTGDLRRGFSRTGDGKRITSGFSYLGAEPAIAWTRACRDPLYPVMKESIETFGQRWSDIRRCFDDVPYHYVSLGPGDGQKDEVILHDLRRNNPGLCYVAVDMSAEMLRLGVHDVIRHVRLTRNRILPVQLDFSLRSNLMELRKLLNQAFGAKPLLVSLLGNTMANFDNDAELLEMLGQTLLRPQDRLILEVATTPRISIGLAQEAADEYGRSRAFREFVTSSLIHCTDLHMDMDSVLFQGETEEGRAIVIKMIYQNQTGQTIRVMLPDRTDVPFLSHDTIRLNVTRKYSKEGLESVLADSGLQALDRMQSKFSVPRFKPGFGMSLLVLKTPDDHGCPDPTPSDWTVADEVWG